MWVTSSYIQIWLSPGLMKWIQESGNFPKVSWNVLIWRKSTLTKVLVTLSLNKHEWVPLELVSSNRGLVGSTIAFYFYISISHTPSQNSVFKSRPVPVAVRNWWLAANVPRIPPFYSMLLLFLYLILVCLLLVIFNIIQLAEWKKKASSIANSPRI